jgi:hypothetical protein
MPNKNASKPTPAYTYCATGQLSEIFGKSAPYFKRLIRSGELIEGVHYCRCPGSDALIWCIEIIRDWFVCGGNTPAHQRAIEKFLAELPSNAA